MFWILSYSCTLSACQRKTALMARAAEFFPGKVFSRVKEIKVNRAYLFPAVLLVCNAGAAVGCAANGDWRKAIYWMASSVCIAAITF